MNTYMELKRSMETKNNEYTVNFLVNHFYYNISYGRKANSNGTKPCNTAEIYTIFRFINYNNRSSNNRIEKTI